MFNYMFHYKYYYFVIVLSFFPISFWYYKYFI